MYGLIAGDVKQSKKKTKASYSKINQYTKAALVTRLFVYITSTHEKILQIIQ